MLPNTLNSYFKAKDLPYGMKSNIKSFNIISVVIRLWNTLPNQIKGTLNHAPFELHIKVIPLQMYS